MDNTQLRQMLEQLHQELENVGDVDDKGRELLETLGKDIQGVLDRSADEEDLPLARSLEESITHFEVTHPTLTAFISQVMSVLSNAGI